jgi:zinc/manganese transport system ATP-binding protein
LLRLSIITNNMPSTAGQEAVVVTTLTRANTPTTDVDGAARVISLRGSGLTFGSRTLWRGLDLDVARGEFIAVLGPNGSGKTSMLKVLLGLRSLTEGTALVNGSSPRRGTHTVGYIPQQKGFDADLGARGRDLVTLGADGHRFGRPWSTRATRAKVDEAIRAVGATAYANRPVGLLSGGEQQRLRTAQALLGDPTVLLCDEPLLSLDLANQRAVVDLIDERRRKHGTSVVFVTHDITPILPYVDRVLYLVDGRWAVGTPDEVMTTESLSRLYGTEIDVLRSRGRIIVVGASEADCNPQGDHLPTPTHS